MRFIFFITVLLSLFFCFEVQGQGLRSFFDAPSFYLTTNDLERASNDAGLGMEFGYAVGGHNMMAKVVAGFQATADFNAENFVKSVYSNPFARIEAGLGFWRTNSSQCGSKQQRAYTAVAKGGLQYNFLGKEGLRDSGADPFLGVELATFMYLDYRKNGEFFIEPGYFLGSKTVFFRIGLRTFINTRA